MASFEEDDSDIQRVLKAAGKRDDPPDDLARYVRAAVQAEWSAVVAERRKHYRRWISMAAAAGIAVAAIGVWLARSSVDARPVTVASVARISGDVKVVAGFWNRAQPVSTAQALQAGESLVTGKDGRAALALGQGVSVRLDYDTKLAFNDAHVFEVTQGTVYVDSQTKGQTEFPLQIDTPAGSVKHLGTQYEVKINGSNVRIRIREGTVMIMPRQGGSQRGEAGEQLLVAADGHVDRTAIGVGDAQWAWVAETAPPFEIDGRRLPEFLAWASRELGKRIVFATPDTELAAQRVVLSGSVSDLAPREAISAVLSTTSLHSVERDGQLILESN